MIEYRAKSWFWLIWRLRGSVLPRIWPPVLASIIIGVIAACIHKLGPSLGYPPRYRPDKKMHVPYVWMPNDVHSQLLPLLSFLLVFRNFLSYSRYWEGNTELAGLVKGAREMMSQTCAYVQDKKDGEIGSGASKRAEYRRLICIQFILVRMHLQACTCEGEGGTKEEVAAKRDLDEVVALTAHEKKELLRCKNRPLKVITWLRMRLVQDVNDGSLSIQYVKQMAPNVTSFIQAWMNAERIIKTPFVFPYAQMVNLFTMLFCMTLPFTIHHIFGWFTPVVAALVSYVLFGINTIGTEIENPFGDDANDLPIKQIEEEIRKDTLEILRCRDPSAPDVALLNEHVHMNKSGHHQIVHHMIPPAHHSLHQ